MIGKDAVLEGRVSGWQGPGECRMTSNGSVLYLLLNFLWGDKNTLGLGHVDSCTTFG